MRDHPENPSDVIRLSLGPEELEVVGPPAAPITETDLLHAFRLAKYPEDDALQLARDLSEGLDRPGSTWIGDILFWVALLSPEHEERIRGYYGLTHESMRLKLARVRAELGL